MVRIRLTNGRLMVLWEGDGEQLGFHPTEHKKIRKATDANGRLIAIEIDGVHGLGKDFDILTLGDTPTADGISVKQAAEELGVTEVRVRQLCQQGRIQGATRIGWRWVIPRPIAIRQGSRGPVGASRSPAGYLTATQAARYLGLSRQRIYQLSEAGQLLPAKANGPVRYRFEDLEDYRERITPGSFHSPQVEGYVTVAEAASAMGLAQTQVTWWIYKGEIESVRIGMRRMIPRGAIERSC